MLSRGIVRRRLVRASRVGGGLVDGAGDGGRHALGVRVGGEVRLVGLRRRVGLGRWIVALGRLVVAAWGRSTGLLGRVHGGGRGRVVHLVRVVRRVLLVEGHALLGNGGVGRGALGRQGEAGVGDASVDLLIVQALAAVAADDDTVNDEGNEEEKATGRAICLVSLAPDTRGEGGDVSTTYQLMAPRPAAPASTLAKATPSSLRPL